MRRVLAASCATLALLWGGEATAGSDDGMSLLGVSQGRASAASYTGPIDAVGVAATGEYSCTIAPRAAAVSTNACILRRASDNATSTINYLANGNFDVASANTFATADATATCTTATTTLTCTGASSTPHVGSTITGVGYTQPCFLTAVGTFTGGAGSATEGGAGCGTVSVGVSTGFQYGLFASEAFDASGNGFHELQATAGSQMHWFPNCGTTNNSLPCLYADGTEFMITNSGAAVAALSSWAAVSERTANFTTQGANIANFNAGGTTLAGYFSSANTTELFNGSANTHATASDSVLHSLQYLATNTSGGTYVDGTLTSGSPGAGSVGSKIGLGASANGAQTMTGYIDEAFVFSGVILSPTQAANLCREERLVYATPGSC